MRVLAEVKAVDQALKEQLRDLNQQVAMNVLGTLMVDLKRTYAEYPSVGGLSAGGTERHS